MSVQITRRGGTYFWKDRELELLRSEFNRRRCVVMRNFLDKELLELIRRYVAQSEFVTSSKFSTKKNLGMESCMAENEVLTALHFLINDERLFDLIEKISDCERIGSFSGRIYRMTAREDHYDSWHQDVSEKTPHRMVGMSVNVSQNRYRGGVFQIRDVRSKQILNEIANVGFGDAIIFPLSFELEHRVTQVEGKFWKTAFAGWFLSKPSYKSFLKKELLRPMIQVGRKRVTIS